MAASKSRAPKAAHGGRGTLKRTFHPQGLTATGPSKKRKLAAQCSQTLSTATPRKKHKQVELPPLDTKELYIQFTHAQRLYDIAVQTDPTKISTCTAFTLRKDLDIEDLNMTTIPLIPRSTAYLNTNQTTPANDYARKFRIAGPSEFDDFQAQFDKEWIRYADAAIKATRIELEDKLQSIANLKPRKAREACESLCSSLLEQDLSLDYETLCCFFMADLSNDLEKRLGFLNQGLLAVEKMQPITWKQLGDKNEMEDLLLDELERTNRLGGILQYGLMRYKGSLPKTSEEEEEEAREEEEADKTGDEENDNGEDDAEAEEAAAEGETKEPTKKIETASYPQERAVVRIRDSKLRYRAIWYQVDWAGHPPDDKWYKKEELGTFAHMIRSFHEAHPEKYQDAPKNDLVAIENLTVERIRDAKLKHGKLCYRVDWVGQPPDNRWHKREDFLHVPELVRAFHEAYPEKACQESELGYVRNKKVKPLEVEPLLSL